MLNNEQLEFLETELTAKGVKFESAQNIFDTNPKAIRSLLIQIQMEESELSPSWGTDENGDSVYNEGDDNYNSYRVYMAEDIERIIMYHELHKK